jgi:hypothetical protein
MRISIPISALLIAVAPSNVHRAHAFVSNYRSPTSSATAAKSGNNRNTAPFRLWYADSPDTLLDMNASEMREELESYGVSTEPDESKNEDSTKNIREKLSTKWENVAAAAKEALKKYATPSSDSDVSSAENYWETVAVAAKEELKKFATPSSKGPSSAENNPSDDQESEFVSSSSSPSSTTATTRQERYEIALEEGRSMSISSLKQELKDRGISTSSFFEKSDLVKAYANAITDDTKDKGSKGHNNQSFDPSYRNVIMQKFETMTLMAGDDVIIDIT